MNFKLKAKTIGWKAAIDATHTMHDEGGVEITQEGLTFKVRDASGHAAEFFHWPKENLISLEIGEEPVRFSYKTDDFKQILGRFANDSEMEVTLEERASSLKLTSLNKHFEMALIPFTEIKVSSTLNALMPVRFEMTMAELNEILSDTKFIGSSLMFRTKDKHIEFECKGDYHTAKIVWKENDAPDCSARFNLEYLVPLASVMKSHADKINVEFGQDTPLHIEFILPAIGTINYFLAPMVLDGE